MVTNKIVRICNKKNCNTELTGNQKQGGTIHCSIECSRLNRGLSPKVISRKCLNCKNLTKNPKFCSKSCSATMNNQGINRFKTSKYTCSECKNEYYKSQKFCSIDCQKTSKRKFAVEAWLKGDFTLITIQGEKNKGILLKFFIDWFKESKDYTCEGILSNGSKCNFREFHPVDNKPGIQIDHIDGDKKNQNKDNLRVLCPNCHWRTKTWGTRNIKNK